MILKNLKITSFIKLAQEDHQFGVVPATVENPAFLAKLPCSRNVTLSLDWIVLKPFCNTINPISRKCYSLTKAELNILVITKLLLSGERM